jgi:hypothetical protein
MRFVFPLKYEETPNTNPARIYDDALVALDQYRGFNNGLPSARARWLDAMNIQPGEHVVLCGCRLVSPGESEKLLRQVACGVGIRSSYLVMRAKAVEHRKKLGVLGNFLALARIRAWPVSSAARPFVHRRDSSSANCRSSSRRARSGSSGRLLSSSSPVPRCATASA